MKKSRDNADLRGVASRFLRPIRSVAATVVLLLSGCAGNYPEIIEVFWQLNLVAPGKESENGIPVERLSFFLHVRDEDGVEDIESIDLLNDQEQLYWRLTDDEWSRFEESNEVWIGSNDIRMYRDGPFPRGAYRVVLTDLAGYEDETSLYITSNRVNPESLSFPTASIRNDTVVLDSRYQRHTLRLYDAGGNVIRVYATSASSIPLSAMASGSDLNRLAEIEVAAYDDRFGVGLISGRYPVE